MNPGETPWVAADQSLFSLPNFALSDPEENTSEPLNGAGAVDLPFLRTLLAIHQKSPELRFYEVIEEPFYNNY